MVDANDAKFPCLLLARTIHQSCPFIFKVNVLVVTFNNFIREEQTFLGGIFVLHRPCQTINFALSLSFRDYASVPMYLFYSCMGSGTLRLFEKDLTYCCISFCFCLFTAIP